MAATKPLPSQPSTFKSYTDYFCQARTSTKFWRIRLHSTNHFKESRVSLWAQSSSMALKSRSATTNDSTESKRLNGPVRTYRTTVGTPDCPLWRVVGCVSLKQADAMASLVRSRWCRNSSPRVRHPPPTARCSSPKAKKSKTRERWSKRTC